MAAHQTQNLPIWERSKSKAIKVRAYLNGDKNFHGTDVTVSRRTCPNFDNWLDELTRKIRPSDGAVRLVFTPKAGHRVNSLETLNDGDRVVVTSKKEGFKKLRYEAIEDPSHLSRKAPHPLAFDVRPAQNRRYQVSGRYNKVDKQGTIIRCWANGLDTVGAKPILLPPIQHRPVSLDDVLKAVDTKMCASCRGPVGSLYLPEGVEVKTVDQIQPNGFYVAVRIFDDFKRGKHYKEFTPANLSTSPRPQRRPLLPPLNHSNKTSSQSSPEHSISSNNGYRRERAKREEDGVFHARPVKHKRSSEKARQTDYDQDNGGVFKAKSQNQATRGARQVEDSHQTKTEVPVDQRQAEEVQEDVKGKGKKNKKGKKQQDDLQEQQRTYRANARLQDSPGNQQARQEAERRREEEDRKRAEKAQRQQEAVRQKEEKRKRKKEEEEEEKRQKEARRRQMEVEEERRKREEEDRQWREEEERMAAEAYRHNDYEDPHNDRDHDHTARDSPYRTGTQMLQEDERQNQRDLQDRTPTPKEEWERRNPEDNGQQDRHGHGEEEMDWGMGPDEIQAVEEEKERAAITIQSHYRGMKARQEANALRFQREG